ncbi:hypothetical protein Bbelb_007830 [Branchiostoma belcheri]|nr:hypothetical protein Bbelb_007830 [Branchiostoma belcheri]
MAVSELGRYGRQTKPLTLPSGLLPVNTCGETDGTGIITNTPSYQRYFWFNLLPDDYSCSGEGLLYKGHPETIALPGPAGPATRNNSRLLSGQRLSFTRHHVAMVTVSGEQWAVSGDVMA